MNWNVKASPHFWRTALPLKEKYTHEQFASIIRSIRKAICELAAKGRVEESGWPGRGDWKAGDSVLQLKGNFLSTTTGN